MTVALYARHKGWPLQDVTVRLRHSRVHAVDCAECETKEGHIDRSQWWFQLSGEADRPAAHKAARHRAAMSGTPDADL